jgi:hypothetical protein
LGHETEKGGGRVVMEKRCKICGETYPLTDEYWYKLARDSYCKQCRKQYNKHYQKQYGHKYRIKARILIKEYQKEYRTYKVKNLSDAYIKQILKKCGIDPTPEWIELKRIQISMKRTLCNIKKLLGGEYEPSHTDV